MNVHLVDLVTYLAAPLHVQIITETGKVWNGPHHDIEGDWVGRGPGNWCKRIKIGSSIGKSNNDDKVWSQAKFRSDTNLMHTEEKVVYLLSTSDRLLPLLISCCTQKSRLPTCYPHQTGYYRCWSAAAHRRVGYPPVIHIRQVTAAVDQLLHTEE